MKTHRAVLLHLPRNKPIDIGFQQIGYTVPGQSSKGSKTILHGVSGLFKSGELTAIMGPSGAGKSSLLNILTGFTTNGTTGCLRIDGTDRRPGESTLRRQSSYILQNDYLPPLFTVSELIWMAAHLKLGSSLSEKAKQLLIDDILETLSLSQCTNTRCNKLSGGQQKRLSIALELVDNPPVMFLDEPTTGLDSSSSLQCISLLKSLAHGGRTIICTIHQPSATVFHMFDHVYVLGQGRCVYQGSSENALSYLQSMGFMCPKYHNPADYMLEVVNGEYGPCTLEMSIAIHEFDWRESLRTIPEDSIVKEVKQDGFVNANKTLVLVQQPSEFTRFWILLQRCYIQLFRDWTVTHLKLLMHIIVGLVMGIYFTDAGNNASKTFVNISYLFCSVVFLSYTAIMPAVLRYPSEMAIIKKEWFNNWYNLRTYYAAFLVSNIPVQMLFAVSYGALSYFLSDQLIDFSRISMFLVICILVTLVSESFGLFLGTVCSVVVNGTFFASVFTAFLLLFGGYLALLNHIPVWLSWLPTICYLKYGFEGMVISVFGYGREALPCPTDESYCHLRTSNKILKELGMLGSSYWTDVLSLVSFFLVLRMCTFFLLRRKISSGS